MVRQSTLIRRVKRFAFHRRAYRFLLAACLALAPAGGAGAGGTAPVIGAAGASIGADAGTLLLRAGLCADGSYDCPDYVPARDYPPRDHANRWAPPPGHYEPEGHYEEQPPCEEPEPRYAAHSFVEHVDPPPHLHEGDWDALCGVRCWYRRLRAGYCGRGCDYYRYRLNEHPEGILLARGERRLACRAED
jgi:hypothetical protein